MKDKLSDISRRMTGTILLLPLMVLFFSGEPYSKITVLICAAFMVLEYSFLATKNINLRIILIGIIGCFGSTSLFLLGPIYHLVFLLLLLVLLLKFFPMEPSLWEFFWLCFCIVLEICHTMNHFRKL